MNDIYLDHDDSRHVVDFLDRIKSYITRDITGNSWDNMRQRQEYTGENPTRTIADREMYKGKKGGIEWDLGKDVVTMERRNSDIMAFI